MRIGTFAALLVLGTLVAAGPSRAVSPPTQNCGTVAGGGARGGTLVVSFRDGLCPIARRVATTWLITGRQRRRIGPWRCARLAHQRRTDVDQVMSCSTHDASIVMTAPRRGCSPIYEGPRPAVRVQIWGLAHTRCTTARRLVAAFLSAPRVHRWRWTCHLPGPSRFTPGGIVYRVGCRRGQDAGVYGLYGATPG